MAILHTLIPVNQKKYSIDQRVYAELIRVLYTQTKLAILGSLFTGFCLVLGLYHVIFLPTLLGWFAALISVSVLRYAIIVLYSKKHPPMENAKYWETLFISITFLSALVWMLAGTVLFPTAAGYQALVGLGLLGVVAGSVPFFAPSLISSFIFVFIVLFPFSVNMYRMGGYAHTLIGSLACFYMLALFFMMLRKHSELRLSLRLKYKNDELISNLYMTKSEVEKVNHELQDEIRERKEIAELLKSSEEQYRLVTDALPVLIAYIDKTLIFRFANKAYEAWFNTPVNQIIGKPIKNILGEKSFSAFSEHLQTLLLGKQVTYETTMYFFNDQERYVSVTLIPNFNHGQVIGVFSLISDMTPRINYLATHDSLTNLPNRSLFIARLTHSLKHAARNNTKVALLFLDLDHFKNVNDTLGHDIGDLLLIKVVERLKEAIEINDTVARLGGDEFTVIIENVTDIDKVLTVAKRICDSLNTVFKMTERDLYITTSIGISLYPDDGENMQILLKNADMAMYRAKAHGRNTFEFYTQGMNEVIQRKLKIETSLRLALENGELKLHYQPIIDIKKNKIVGLEVLSRWENPEMGMVPSAEFFAVAEETDLILPISDWVLRTACQQSHIWQKQGFDSIRISVNVSPRQFRSKNLIDLVKQTLIDTNLKGENLILELTESLIMADIDYTIKMVKALKELDVQIAIDDFGTGYSSLGYLKRFPFDIIKIDRAFITDFSSNPDDAAIVRAIIGMAHSLKMTVVAEGVEKPEQYLFLQEYGCDEVQGFLFFPPLSETDVVTVLEERGEYPFSV